MTPEQFCYWLQGYTEVNQKAPNDAQWNIIKDHLATVFTKVTPNYPSDPLRYDPLRPYTTPYVAPLTAPGIPPTSTCSVESTRPYDYY